MTQTTTINIDIGRPNIPAVVYAKQHDKDTRKVEVSLYNNGVAYTVPASTSGQVNIAKPDGTGCYYDVDSISENKVTFTLVEQALAAAGTAKAEVSLLSTESDEVIERLTSFSFDIIIEQRVIEDSSIVSSDYYNALLDLEETVQRSVTFTPSVSNQGVISWTNDGGLTNPSTVDLLLPFLQRVLFDGAGAHNAIYRGKKLGDSVTADQLSAISSGAYTDMYVGDYWEDNGEKYYIAHFEYGFANSITCICKANVGTGNGKMTTSEGYKGTAIRSNLYSVTLPKLQAYFGSSHIKSQRTYISTGISISDSGSVSLYSGEDNSKVELLKCSMICGRNDIIAVAPPNYNNMLCYPQLSIFRYVGKELFREHDSWVQDINNSYATLQFYQISVPDSPFGFYSGEQVSADYPKSWCYFTIK